MAINFTKPSSFTGQFSSLKSLDDPVAQTFEISKDHCPDSDGCYITSIAVHFAAKDPNFGINFDLRTVEAGMPTRTVLPFSQVHYDNIFVNTSVDGSAVTMVYFKAPVYVKAGRKYAFTIRPDGQVPTYKVFISKLGNADLRTGEIVTSNWGEGAFFTSASQAWTPISGVDLKFRVYRAQFDLSIDPQVTLVNDDYEFLTVQTSTGTFQEDEELYKLPASFNTGNVSTTLPLVTDNADANTVNAQATGVSTAFNNSYSPGDSIVIRSRANSSIADVVTVDSVESNTALTIRGGFKIGVNDGEAALTPTALVKSFDPAAGDLTLIASTASNSTHKFEAGDTVIGTESGATATITTVDNRIVSYYLPHIYKTTPSRTRVESSAVFRNSANTQTTNKTIAFGMQNKISDMEVAVYSKSNEISGTDVVKSLVITNELKYNTPVSAPMLDVGISNIQAFKNTISNDNSNEKLAGVGSANTKYVSKLVNLSSGIESDDIEMYLTGYRPPGSEFEVYAKIINEADNDTPNNRQWTKLGQTQKQAEMFSNINRPNDFREFRYFIPTSPTVNETNKQPGTANTTADSTTVSIASASTYYSSGDLIYLGNSSKSYFVGRVSSANSSAVVLYEASDRISDSVNHYKILDDEKQSAFRYIDNAGQARLNYYDSSGRKYDNFTKFQIKVVFLADQTNTVPKLQDIRAIALTA
jgi:hypothetical protein